MRDHAVAMKGDLGSGAGVDGGPAAGELSSASGLLPDRRGGCGEDHAGGRSRGTAARASDRSCLIDLDWLSWCAVSFDEAAQLERRRLLVENLAMVWGNYRRHGVTRIVLAGSIVSQAHLGAVRRALGDIALFVIRIDVSVELALERLELRDPASKTAGSIDDLRAFSEKISEAGVESGVVENTERAPAVTARQIAAMAGWLPSAG